MKRYIVHDRYSSTGTPRPTSKSCKRCDGMGYHPTRCTCSGRTKGHTKNELSGWCWVKPCTACNGSRVSSATK